MADRWWSCPGVETNPEWLLERGPSASPRSCTLSFLHEASRTHVEPVVFPTNRRLLASDSARCSPPVFLPQAGTWVEPRRLERARVAEARETFDPGGRGLAPAVPATVGCHDLLVQITLLICSYGMLWYLSIVEEEIANRLGEEVRCGLVSGVALSGQHCYASKPEQFSHPREHLSALGLGPFS